MSSSKQTSADGGEEDRGYDLEWPSSLRWNPHYSVPRNSIDRSAGPPHIQGLGGTAFARKHNGDTANHLGDSGDEEDGVPSLNHWLETLAEVYMNELDNRARWDPRWLNITRRERFQGLGSARVTIVDYLRYDVVRSTFTDANSGSVRGAAKSSSKKRLAAALNNRPSSCSLRVIVVTDLSRFVMGALGQLFHVDPEFWFEHLANSGYCASDANIKIRNAVWMNWAQRETRFRHRALPGPGQPTEWNTERHRRRRFHRDGKQPAGKWAHMRWGRLGSMHYLGRGGFYEEEMELRIDDGDDGRLIMERDVALDKFGISITRKGMEAAAAARRRKEEDPVKPKTTGGEFLGPFGGGGTEPPNLDAGGREGSARVKASNVYRPYSTFTTLPKNRKHWRNRDLRVMAPEGASVWSGTDDGGRLVVLVVLDPARAMRNVKTGELTPSLTFMPRPMEIEAYTDEELWRTADPEETYLDPPPLPLSKDQRRAERKARKRLRQQKEEKRKAREKEAKKKAAAAEKAAVALEARPAADVGVLEEGGPDDDDDDDDDDDRSVVSYSSNISEDEYREEWRNKYKDPKWYTRDRDFARKYALPTDELVLRHILPREKGAGPWAAPSPLLPAIVLAQLSLDDLWQLLAEVRLGLDHADADMATDLHLRLAEIAGIALQKDLSWARDTAREVREWVAHLTASFSSALVPGEGCCREERQQHADLLAEMAALSSEVAGLQARIDSTLQLLLASVALAQSVLVIKQTSGVNKLTELAFIFIPLSFITSVFSMQVVELTAEPPSIRVWAATLAVVFVVTYSIRIFLRSPSIRWAGMVSRATIMNRFTSRSSASASNRLNSLSTRAVLKFAFVMSLTLFIFGPFFTACILSWLLTWLVWFGTAAVSVYFLATCWPDPVVLGLCFGLGLPFSVVGLVLRYRFCDQVDAFWERAVCHPALQRLMLRIRDKWLPHKWYYDNEVDADLAKEGYSIYARQKIVGA